MHNDNVKERRGDKIFGKTSHVVLRLKKFPVSSWGIHTRGSACGLGLSVAMGIVE